MARIFKYGDQTWGDPGAEFSNEDVKAQLAQFFPELARATAKERALPDGSTEIEFVKNAGTKGADGIPQYAYEWALLRGNADVEAFARQRAAWMRQAAEVLSAIA